MSSTFVPAFAILCAIQAGLVPSVHDLAQTLALSGLTMTKAIVPTSTNVPDNNGEEGGESGASDCSSSFPLLDDPFASDNDLTGERTTPRVWNVSQFLAAIVQLWQVVAGLLVHVSVMAKAIVQLQDKVSKIENSQQESSASDEREEATSMQLKALWNAMTAQQDHLSNLKQELAHQRQEIDQYRKNFEELTAKFDDDGKQFNEFMSGLKSALVDQVNDQTRQAKELAAVKSEMTRKFTVLNAELKGVQTDLSLAKSFPVPSDPALAGQTAKEARRARILAHVAQRMEEKELAQEIEILCPLPGARSSACEKENKPVASSSSTPAQGTRRSSGMFSFCQGKRVSG
ncbi:hypothetical protein F5I97DRAFT_1099445 [Phlebopus sp. FC_14]|nr:hypothetical protein F5I97DRAFT_1099445 [Phlebopus sp. FC_14]